MAHIGPLRIAVLTDAYPVVSETFVTGEVAALSALGAAVSVECDRSGEAAAAPGVPAHALSDDSRAARARDLAWLVLRHPRGVVRDLRARPRWRREEGVRPLRQLSSRARRLARRDLQHLHVHFAAHAALDAMRLGAILGIPYSITAHAYDIFQLPRNLPEKLTRAAFSTTGCEYNARHLRGLLSPEAAARLHVMVMGVDTEFWRRTSPLPGGRHIVAVGRLVLKKGFADLLAALALVPDATLTLIGDGPLRAELRAVAQRLGVADRVTFTGALTPEQIREELERADVLCAPSVIAPDGDRDSMPVVVKEAMAMELPVVVTDVAGLPEMVVEDRGRVTPPGDPVGLARALEECLRLPPEERTDLGRAGRCRVMCRADRARATAHLLASIARPVSWKATASSRE